jgi:hypothetical protein
MELNQTSNMRLIVVTDVGPKIFSMKDFLQNNFIIHAPSYIVHHNHLLGRIKTGRMLRAGLAGTLGALANVIEDAVAVGQDLALDRVAQAGPAHQLAQAVHIHRRLFKQCDCVRKRLKESHRRVLQACFAKHRRL